MGIGRTAAAAVLAAAGLLAAAPAARADDDVRVVVRLPGASVTFGGHHRDCRYVPGRWAETVRRVMVRPGYWRVETVPAAFEVRFDLGRWRFERVCVRHETTRRAWVAPVYGDRVTRSWVPGRWECRHRCDG